MSEAEKTKYWDILSQRFMRFYNFATETGINDKEILRDLYEYRVATKGILLNSTRKIKQHILETADPDLTKDYLTWIDQKEELTRLYVYSRSELKEQNINIDSIESVVNAMEKKLSEQSKDFLKGYVITKPGFKDVKKVLKDHEAVVEIIRLRKYDQTFTDDCKYVALIITKDTESPALVVMENGISLETQFSKSYRFAIKSKSEDINSYNQYWAPLESDLKGRKTIYVSADGVYQQLNLYTFKKTGW